MIVNARKLQGKIQVLVVSILLLMTAPVMATLIDESVDGDLSDDPNIPTLFSPMSGMNSIIGSTVSGDFDIVNVSVGAGLTLDSIFLANYSSLDNLGFIAVQTGATWTEGLGGAIDPTNLLGWSHFGPGNGTVGTDILDDMGTAFGSTGFVSPLGEGDYTFLIQQTGSAIINYQLDFTVSNQIPLPSTTALLTIGLCSLVMVRRRKIFKLKTH